jgi:hypothetical protein
MKFPHLVWAIGQKRCAHYGAAAAAGASESRFSRCLVGRAEFSSVEQQKLAAFFGYPAEWLFQEVNPPKHVQRTATGQEVLHL